MNLKLLQASLSYEPETGVLRWVGLQGNKVFRNGQVAGQTLYKHGVPCRVRVKLDNHWYSASRVAYILMTGEDIPPGFMLDHVDRNPCNQRWLNLRLATSSQNNANRVQKRRSPRAVGLPPGVGRGSDGYYRVLITKDNQVVFEAKTSCLTKASSLAKSMSLKFHGEFSPYSTPKPLEPHHAPVQP